MAELTTSERDALPAAAFAYPQARKLPLVDADHVRNAIARFGEVTDVSDADRAAAWRNVKDAAREFGVRISEHTRREHD